ncbi:MAG TPA: hypothetical protein VGX51_02325 [Solirubrobacteraceae bacterium]|jgi:hypothetical protein|nr:hypothetical protein [Solirubrobacteraceae bacterium]
MARITVQTDDRRIVLEERDVHADQLRDEPSASHLRDRLSRAVQDAERPPVGRRRVRRLASIVPARDYRLVGA